MHAIRSWPEIVGYRFEFLHTAVLAELLRSDYGPQLAAALLGDDYEPDAGPAVSGVQLEPRIGTSRRKADLQFVAERAIGDDLTVIVETKVDSLPPWDQLHHLATASPPGSRFVYFVLGYSEYLIPREAVEHAFDGHALEIVTARRWVELLDRLTPGLSGDLMGYRDAVEAEIAARERLKRAVSDADSCADGLHDLRANESGWAERVVWLSQVREALAAKDGLHWLVGPSWSYQSSAAVQFGLERLEWTIDAPTLGGRANVYVEVIANDDGFRWLAFKTGGATATLRARLDGDRIRRAVESHPDLHAGKGRRASERQTATAVTIDLSALSPIAAAEHILHAIAAVEDEVLAVVRDACFVPR